MNEYLPWIVLLALLAGWAVHWIGAKLRGRGRGRPGTRETALEVDTEIAPTVPETKADIVDLGAHREAAERAQRQAHQEALVQVALEAERQAALERSRQKAEQAEAAAAALRLEAQRQAAAQAARVEAARVEAARAEAARAEAARVEAQRRAAAEAARMEAAADAARREAQRHAAQEQERARMLARQAAEDAARAAAERQAEARAAPEARPVRTPEQTRVMVADDSKVVRVKTSRLLAKHSYQVALAEDGLDAVRQIEAGMPDVLITDVEMPGMDGFELARYLRNNPRTAHIPILMITAADDKHRAEAAEAGVNVLLGKPYEEDELIAYVEATLNGFANTGAAELAVQ